MSNKLRDRQRAEVKATIFQTLEDLQRRGLSLDIVENTFHSVSLALAEQRGADGPTLLHKMADGIETLRYVDDPSRFGPVQ